MSYGFLDIAVTPSVRAVQAKMGVDRIWQDFKGIVSSIVSPRTKPRSLPIVTASIWRRFRKRAGLTSSTAADHAAS